MAEILVDYAAHLDEITLTGLSTLPGAHVTVAGERILAHTEAADVDAGIWVVAAGAWTRATDFDTSAEVTFNTKIYPRFSDGATGVQSGSEFYVATTGTINPGTDAFAIVQRSYAVVQTAGDGIERFGDEWSQATTGIPPGSYDVLDVDERGNAIEGRAAEGVLTFIEGLKLVRQTGTQMLVSEGAAYIPGLDRTVDLFGDSLKSGLSISADTWYAFYLFENANEADWEHSSTAPDAPYRGTARTKGGGTPDNTRRFIGWGRANATGGSFRNFEKIGNWVWWLDDTGAAPFRVASGLTANTYTNVSCAAVVPPTVRVVKARVFNSTNQVLRLATPGVGAAMNSLSVDKEKDVELLLSTSQNLAYKFDTTPVSGTMSIDILAYLSEV